MMAAKPTRGGADKHEGLDAPSVPASSYDHDYFLYGCMGADTWRASSGASLAGMYPGMLRLAGLQPGMRVLDVGTGRGELLVAAIELGAEEAVGVDYSPAAIELARVTLERSGRSGRAEVRQGDARRLPVDDGRFDLVTMLDVVEHLDPGELEQALSEAWRALRPGARLFVHTMPNRLIYDVTYRLLRRAASALGRTWPAEPRTAYERDMHVNEQRVGTLRRSLRRAGFEGIEVWAGEWVHTDFLPGRTAKRLYRLLARLPALRRLAAADIYARATRPG